MRILGYPLEALRQAQKISLHFSSICAMAHSCAVVPMCHGALYSVFLSTSISGKK